MTDDLVALPLPEAIDCLAATGETLAAVVSTGPPGAGRGLGAPRVIRQRRRAEGVELTVAFPRLPSEDAPPS